MLLYKVFQVIRLVRVLPAIMESYSSSPESQEPLTLDFYERVQSILHCHVCTNMPVIHLNAIVMSIPKPSQVI
jgi:hypothetical protein